MARNKRFSAEFASRIPGSGRLNSKRLRDLRVSIICGWSGSSGGPRRIVREGDGVAEGLSTLITGSVRRVSGINRSGMFWYTGICIQGITFFNIIMGIRAAENPVF